MPSSTILVLYIALALLDLGWTVYLTVRNYRSTEAGGGAVPEALAGSVKPEEAAKASEYSAARMRLSLVQGPAITAVVVAVVAAGLLGGLDSLVGRWIGNAYWRGAAFLAAAAIGLSILSAPFDLYGTFVLEKRFGFNKTTARTYVLDLLKSLLVSAALGLPLLALLYAFMDWTGGLWWLWAAAAFSVVDIGLSILYPLVIAPLFNKFAPLPEGSLKARIGELSARLDFKVAGVFVMDGSKRSKHSNAYFTGIGRAKRVVLYDTLVEGSAEDEILAVLAHEIGHEKKRHILKGTILSVVLSFALFYVLGLMLGWVELYGAFGFSGPSRHAILLILSLVQGPATFFLAPALSAWSRKHEYEADEYAARATSAAALSSALVRLNSENASNLWPDRLYSAWYYSHPTLVERLAAIRKAGA